MAHIDVSGIDYFLSDGTQLLNGVTFKVPDGTKTALIGPNGTGKTTLFRIISGDLVPDEGVVGRSGNMGIMRQFVGQVRDESTVRDLLVSAAPPALAGRAATSAPEPTPTIAMLTSAWLVESWKGSHSP